MAQHVVLETPPDDRGAAGSQQLPECLTRDNLTSPYFPQTSPSLLAAVVALCLVFLFISIHRLNHTDLWGHLNFGRWMAEHGRLPAQEPFSAEPPAGPIVNVPWLSQLGGYFIYRLLGAEGLVLIHAVLATLSTGLLMLAITRRGVPLLCGVVGGVTAILLALPVVGTIRPQLCGIVALPLVLYGLGSNDRHRFRPWLLAGLFALWANLHGSFAVGLVLLALDALTRTGTTWFERKSEEGALGAVRSAARDPSLRRCWLALILAVCGSCLNPLGPWLLWEVGAFGMHEPLSDISEWRALTLGSLSGGLFYGSLAVTGILVWMSPRRLTLLEVATLVVFGLLTLSAMRMLTWWALIWPWAMAPTAYAAWRQLTGPDLSLPECTPRQASMQTLFAIALVFVTLLLAPPSRALICNAPRGVARVTGQGTPWYVADELERRKAEGNLFAPMDWADYLVWTSHERIKPLVYSHVHLLDDPTWDTYQRIWSGDPQWLELLKRHKLKYVIIDRERNRQLAVAVLMAERNEQPPLRVIYRDERCLMAEVL